MRSLLVALAVGIALSRQAAVLMLASRRDRDAEGAMWREFGLRRALANMPSDSPGRAVVEALLARGTLTEEEGRRFKRRGLRAALDSMPSDSPGRVVVQALLDRELRPGRSDDADVEDFDRPTVAESKGGGQVLDNLERLVALRERGHLTNEEFEAAKRKLLS
jgi:hypothetical protein